jgi:hypothetical protein
MAKTADIIGSLCPALKQPLQDILALGIGGFIGASIGASIASIYF